MKVLNKSYDFKYDGDISVVRDSNLLVGCSQGILLFGDDMDLWYLATTQTYGITRDASGRYWCARTDNSQIRTFNIVDNKIKDIECVLPTGDMVSGEKKGLHQIDFIDNELHVMDTYNNRVIIYNDELKVTRIMYPNGFAKNAYPKNPLHKHFNSIYDYDNSIYLIAHNNSVSTKKPSEIFVYDKPMTNVMSIIPETGFAAHNIIVDKAGVMHVCDSMNHRLISISEGNTDVLFTDKTHKSFTRGLAMNDDIIVMGGSKRGKKNTTVNALLFFLDKKDYSLLCTIVLYRVGQIHEVRFTGLDYGYSNTRKT